MNETQEKKHGALRCTSVGNLIPADICGKCDGCSVNQEFADNNGCPGVLLTGTMDEVKHAVTSGILFENVVVINAERFNRLEAALKRIAEYELCDDFEEMEQAAGYMKSVAKEALEAEA